MRHTILLLTCLVSNVISPSSAQDTSYEVYAIRYATIPDFPLSVLVQGADSEARVDIAMVFWLIRGRDRVVLFDTGFHRPTWFERFTIHDYVRPDEAVLLAGSDPDSVTDIVVSHAHWDHMGGIDLFPNAVVWIQALEFTHYTGPAWQSGRQGGGSDPEDLIELVSRNTSGLVRLIDGDDVEILPGLRVYTGARHTYASQYLVVEGEPVTVLASDNAYLYANLEQGRPVATFTPADSTASKTAIRRMLDLTQNIDHVVPGHDFEQFRRFPTRGRVARIR